MRVTTIPGRKENMLEERHASRTKENEKRLHRGIAFVSDLEG